ncbi:transcriptional regulator BetI [Streptomyces sp. ADI96-02]|uniref:TetR/AcrR family transcriptional regulator n=1 Tax=Streptomyces sp. ADI96-02 TaxID=1522760 RepID=UPI000F556947|nr:TetR/AcrR family transcriptional regulator [Streptomyces sp. ADI96-02]RPK54192.1 transcriptional regulator BetI [Streptomyces sp. ADI96-02]
MDTARGASDSAAESARAKPAAANPVGTKGVPRARREAQILGAATEEFGRHGHAAASMASIARRVGVTKPLLYTYFGSKDGLYLACLEAIAAPLVSAVDAAMAEGPPGSGTPGASVPQLVLEAVFRTLEGRRHAWFVLYDRTLRPGSELHTAARRHRGRIDALAVSGTAEVLRAHGDDDPLDADALKHVWTGTVSALVGWWISHPDQSARDMAVRCSRLLAAIRDGA